jgi:Ca2+/H+ antiporter
MVIDSKERIRDKMNFATQGVMDNSNFSIAIAVGIFAVLTLFIQITEPQLKWDILTIWIARITLSVAYWVLILMGLVAHAHHRMYNAVLENYIRNDYVDYQEDLRNVAKKNRIISWTVNFLWLNKTSERINRDYSFVTISFFVISFFLFIGIARPWSWFT